MAAKVVPVAKPAGAPLRRQAAGRQVAHAAVLVGHGLTEPPAVAVAAVEGDRTPAAGCGGGVEDVGGQRAMVAAAFQSQPGDLAQLLGDHARRYPGRCRAAGAAVGQHLRRPSAGADREDVAEALLVGPVALLQRRPDLGVGVSGAGACSCRDQSASVEAAGGALPDARVPGSASARSSRPSSRTARSLAPSRASRSP